MAKESGFYPAGQKVSDEEKEPVRPQTEESKEVCGAERKEEKVGGAADRRQYQKVVEEERSRGEDGARRESPSTGGASGSTSEWNGVRSPTASEEQVMEGRPESEEERAHAEARLAKGLSQPVEPSAAQVAAHKLNHLPYESWCPICVEAKGQERAHFKKKDEEDDDRLPQFGLDYGFYSDDLKREEKRKPGCVVVAIMKEKKLQRGMPMLSRRKEVKMGSHRKVWPKT